MAVKIWDSVAGAFTDAATPQAWDSSLQAYGGSTGLAYDAGAGAWEERWSPAPAELYVFKSGEGLRMGEFSTPNTNSGNGSQTAYINGTEIYNNVYGTNTNGNYQWFSITIPEGAMPREYKRLKIQCEWSRTGTFSRVEFGVSAGGSTVYSDKRYGYANTASPTSGDEIFTIGLDGIDLSGVVVVSDGGYGTAYCSITEHVHNIWFTDEA